MYGPQSGRTVAEKEHFYDDFRSEWDLHNVGELALGMGDFNGHFGKQIEGYEDVHGGNGMGERNVEGKMVEICDEKELSRNLKPPVKIHLCSFLTRQAVKSRNTPDIDKHLPAYH